MIDSKHDYVVILTGEAGHTTFLFKDEHGALDFKIRMVDKAVPANMINIYKRI